MWPMETPASLGAASWAKTGAATAKRKRKRMGSRVSFFSQRRHRLQSGGTARGPIAGQHGYSGEQQNRGRKRGRVVRLQAEQKGAGRLSGPQREAGSDDQPERQQ